jgi:hypothetical protein
VNVLPTALVLASSKQLNISTGNLDILGRIRNFRLIAGILNFSIEEIGVEVESGGREKFQQMLL